MKCSALYTISGSAACSIAALTALHPAGAQAGLLCMMQACMPVVMLSEQYRMAPPISAFPSRFFYEGGLVDGTGVHAQGLPAILGRAYLQPFAVFNCRYA